MNKKIRFTLFGIFVAAWFILTALILPFAFGYQLNFSVRKFQKTGMFDIATEPSGATIYLNDQVQKNWWQQLIGRDANFLKTPAKLRRLLPGSYEVRLELAGYWPWTKRLEIKANETTYLEDVYFFRQDTPQAINLPADATVKAVEPAPDKKTLAVLTDKELFVFAWGQTTPLTQITLPKINASSAAAANAASAINWASDNNRLLLGSWLVDLKNEQLTDLAPLFKNKVRRWQWQLDGKNLYAESTDGFYQLTPASQKPELLLSKKETPQTWLIKDNYLYWLKNQPNLLLMVKLSNGQTVETIKLPAAAAYRFINPRNRWLNLYDEANKKLYLLDYQRLWSNEPTLKEIGNLTLSYWVDDERLLYANDFEIWLWQRSSNQDKLLTRSSQRLQNLSWHPSDNYVLFATDQGCYTLELDDRDKYNITALLESPNLNWPQFANDGKQIFFYGAVNGQKGFYFLSI